MGLTRLALLTVAAGAVAVAVLVPRDTPAVGPVADQQVFEQTRRILIGSAERPVTLHRVVVDTACPAMLIEWGSTNLEPTTPGSRAIVELRLDGRVVANGRAGAGAGIFEDGPARIVWYGEVRPGRHVVEAVLRGAGASFSWGLPYLDVNRDGPRTGLDGLSAWPLGASGGSACAATPAAAPAARP